MRVAHMTDIGREFLTHRQRPFQEKEMVSEMAIQFRDIPVAPLPVKEKKVRQPRVSAYNFDGIAVGGARAFPIGDKEPKKAKAAVYQAAMQFRKKNADFAFKVVLKETDGEVWVHRVAAKEGNGGSPAADGGTAFKEAAE